MKNKIKKWACNMSAGWLIFAICMGGTIVSDQMDFIDFMLTLVVIGLCIATKLIINQYTSLRINHLLNSLALYMLYVHISALFAFFVKGVGQAEKLNLQLSWVCSGTFGAVTSLIIVWLMHSSKKKEISNYSITAAYMIVVFIIYRLLKSSPDIKLYMLLVTILVIVPDSIYFFYIPRKYRKELGGGREYFICFAAFRMVQFLLLGLCWRFKYYQTINFALHCIQAYYLLKSALTICIELPLNEKLAAVDQAEHKIEAHSRSSTMIVNLSHELKTPVNVIRSATDLLLLDCQEDKKLNHSIKHLKTECNKVMNVIQDMIDIQKIYSKNIKVRYGVYNMVELLDNVVEAFVDEYPDCHIIFNPEEEEIYSMIDQQLVQQGMIQLTALILKGNSEKTIYLDVESKAGHTIQIKMTHPSAAYISRLLERLKAGRYQEDTSDLLAIQHVEKVLKLNKGEIQCTGEDKPLSVVISLPLRKCDADEAAIVEEKNIMELREIIKCHYLNEED